MCQLTNPRTAKNAKRGQESRNDVKKKILGCSVKCATAEPDKENQNGCANTATNEKSRTEAARPNEQRKMVLQELRIELDASRAEDDNKENVSNADQEVEALNNSHAEDENRQLENNENVPLKVRELRQFSQNADFICT